MATPKKFFKVLQLTPKTKKFVCVLCGNRTEISDYRRKLFHGIRKTEYCLLIEELLGISITEDFHTDSVCRKCLRDLQKADSIVKKLKSAYENTLEKLKETHGKQSGSFKRQSTDETETTSRKALFVTSDAENVKETEDIFVPPRPFSSEVEISVNYSGFERSHFSIRKDFEPLIIAITEGSSETISDAVMNNSQIQAAIIENVLSKLKKEVKSLCSKESRSLLRNKDTESFVDFSWANISQEWREKVPLFHQFLDAVTFNPSQERNKIKKGDHLLPAVISAGCKLLSIYSKDMNLLQSINSLLLLKGGCKKSAFTRLNMTNDCLSYQVTLALAERVGNKWSDDITSWKEAVESDASIEQNLLSEISDVRQTLDLVIHSPIATVDTMFQLAELEQRLEAHRKSMHPGYYFVGDNVDMRTSVRHMTISNQAKDQHMYQMCAYMNRVPGNMLDNSRPKGNIETVAFKTFLPSEDDVEDIYSHMSHLVAVHWVRMIPCFKQYESVIPTVIEHPHMKETKKRSERINLGVLQKNEQYNDDMTDICTFLHQYVPGHDSSDSWQTKPQKVLSGGDYLTFERHKQAQASKRDGRTPSKRLEGLVPKMEEFHNEGEFLAVIWRLLYSASSAKDSGTLYSARNAINARKVTKLPSDDFYASSYLFEKFTVANIVCGGLHYFEMESLQSEPKVHKYTGEIGNRQSMNEYLTGHAKSFVKTYAEIRIPKLPDFGPQSNSLNCRYCQKHYQRPKALRKHEANLHGHPDPLYNTAVENSLGTPEQPDYLLNYTKLAVTLGLLRLNQMDALRLGDGERILKIDQVLYLFYKTLGFPKYAYGMLETLAQTKVLLSERMAHRLIWNRTVNHRGEIDSNHPNDLDVEHCNKAFKEDAHSYRGIFTEKTISRVSHSALYLKDIANKYDKISHVFGQSGKHTEIDTSEDILVLVRQFQAAKVFDYVPGRSHMTFPMFDSNPLSQLDMENFQGLEKVYTRGFKQSIDNGIITTCDEHGNWTQPQGLCQVVECPKPENSVLGYQITNPLAKYNYSTLLEANCNEGYELTDGNLTRTCRDNGTWSGKEPVCMKSSHKKQEKPSVVNVSSVIGGSVGAAVAVIILLLFIGMFVLMRRKRQKSNATTSCRSSQPIRRDEHRLYSNANNSFRSTQHPNTSANMEYSCIDEFNKTISALTVTDTKADLDVDNSFFGPPNADLDTQPPKHEDEYYNITAFDKMSPTAIMLEDLTDFVLSGKTPAKIIETQFLNLPTGLVKNHNSALKSENAKKNRYKQIYAYDDNRVVLYDGVNKIDNDYINASFIHGYDSARAYVASQGPTKDTIEDFLRMIWQLKSEKIVMLTNLKEEGKMKCKQYWPENGSQRIGNIIISLKGTEVCCDFAIRTLELQQSNEQRIIQQFHFTAWPDRGVPKFASALVNFKNKVRNAKSEGNHPTVVHCSAGIGRTGTYIALDILTQQGQLLGYVDVAGTVASLRRQRVNMVQNLDQYVFLHSALTEALMLTSSAIPAAQFPQVYRELLQDDPVKRRRNIQSTYDMLKHMSPIADENQYISAREVRNKKRNRYSNILPVSEFMPSLGGASKDGYINAVVLPSYKERNALILTQMPLENTKSDFWALVREHNIHTIVMMNTVADAEKEEIYWPDVGESQTFNNVEIETDSVETIGQHTVVTMIMNDGDSERTIKQVQCLYWPLSQSLPKSAADIIQTIELVQTLQQHSGNHPIVVHCMNGVDRSGLFCVVSAVIERLKIEQDVAITQVIEQMRCCRDQLIPSVEQFQFCHEVVLTYIQQFNEYSNFSSM